MNVIIRNATIEDLSTLLEFEQGVIDAERPMDADLRLDDMHYYDIKELIEAPHIKMAVAQIGEQLVGCGYAKIETAKSWHNFDKHAYLGFMYTDPAHRGKGINPALVDDLKEWCRAQGVYNLALEVYHNNPAAIRAYEKVGFATKLLELRIEISK